MLANSSSESPHLQGQPAAPQSRGVSEGQGLKRDEGRAALQKEFAVLYGKTSLVAHLFLLHQARM